MRFILTLGGDGLKLVDVAAAVEWLPNISVFGF